MRQVGDFIGEHLRLAEDREGDSLYHFWAAMAVVSAALERKCWLDRGNAGGIFYPNLYVVLVGPSANGKTYSADLAIEYVKEIPKITNEGEFVHFTADKLTPAVLAEQLCEAEEYVELPKGGFIQSPLFAYSGELAVYLNDIGGGSLIPDLLRYYDPGGGPGLNTFKKRTVSKGTVTIHNPSVVMLGATIPDYMRSLLFETSGYGFVSRTILVVSFENSKIISEPKPEDKLLKAKLAATLAHIHTELRGKFKETKSAIAVYKKWYVAFRKWFDANRRGLSRVEEEYYGRKKVQIFKVAMCLSAAREDSLEIRGEHIEEAIERLTELEDTLFSVAGNLNQKDDFYTRLNRFFFMFPKDGLIEAVELRRRSISLFPTERELVDALRRLRQSGAVLAKEENGKVFYFREGDKME